MGKKKPYYPRKSVRPHIKRVFEQNPGLVLYAEEISAETGLTERQVMMGVYNLRHDEPEWGEAIEVVSRARAWTYTQPRDKAAPAVGERLKKQLEEPDPSKYTFTLLGVKSNGDLLLEDPDGELYKAQKLD